jgi:hypothetical protein
MDVNSINQICFNQGTALVYCERNPEIEQLFISMDRTVFYFYYAGPQFVAYLV